MPNTRCSWSRGKSTCSYQFRVDSHSLCVLHRDCVSHDFVYDPMLCDVCRVHVCALRDLGPGDSSSASVFSLSASWEAVVRSA